MSRRNGNSIVVVVDVEVLVDVVVLVVVVVLVDVVVVDVEVEVLVVVPPESTCVSVKSNPSGVADMVISYTITLWWWSRCWWKSR